MNELIVPTDPSVICDYQQILLNGICGQCGKTLVWKTVRANDDDRFCHAYCCLTKYSLVPERVRVLSVATLFSNLEDEIMHSVKLCVDEDADEEFIKELRSMGEEQDALLLSGEGAIKAEFQPPW